MTRSHRRSRTRAVLRATQALASVDQAHHLDDDVSDEHRRDGRRYAVVIDVPNPDQRLRLGMTAEVVLGGAQRQAAVRIPNSALSFRPAPEDLPYECAAPASCAIPALSPQCD